MLVFKITKSLQCILKMNVDFLFHVVFSNYFRLHDGEITSKLKTHHEGNS